MSHHTLEQVELTNMAAVIDRKNHKVLVQERVKSWCGIAFPGGHVEKGESVVLSTIREIKEETGLLIKNLKSCGIKDWYEKDQNKRYIVFLYCTEDFSGELREETPEGKVFWVDLDHLPQEKLSSGFIEMAEMMLGQRVASEFYYEIDNEDWKKKFY